MQHTAHYIGRCNAFLLLFLDHQGRGLAFTLQTWDLWKWQRFLSELGGTVEADRKRETETKRGVGGA